MTTTKNGEPYLDYINAVIPAREWLFIREAVDRGQLTGYGRYIEEVEKIIGRRIEHHRQGRPKKDDLE